MNDLDHDLLIAMKAEFSTKLDRVIADVKELKENVADRVSALEIEKMNKEEAERYKEAADKIHADHEERLRVVESDKIPKLENWRWYVIGITVAAVFILGYLVQFLSK